MPWRCRRPRALRCGRPACEPLVGGLTQPCTDLAWLHRTGEPGGASRLADAVGAVTFPPGRAHAFVHGEAGETRAVRRHLLADRGLAPEDLSCSPYWRRGMTDEEWRQVKAAWNADVERDVV